MSSQQPSKSIDNLVTINQNILYRSDCKEALQKLIDKGVKVDLIYLDPPFNSNRVYNMIYRGKGRTAQQKAFSDMWSYTSQTQQMLLHFKENLEEQQGVSDVVKNFLKMWIESIQSMSSNNQKLLSYLIYMAERLVLMKQILKDTGSIYYHCDSTASHYIKIIMDGIFEHENFRNEIIWYYPNSGLKARSKKFHQVTDTILYYIQDSKKLYFNPIYKKRKDGQMKQAKRKFNSITKKADMVKDENGKIVYIIRKEVLVNSLWEIPSLSNNKKEQLGYPTQKPLALLERIIKASCPENGLVLDPFCGCGTTTEAAIKLNRKWIGIDISPLAINVIKERIKARCLGSSQADYIEFDGSPESKNSYDKLNPFQKQDFLIRKVGGLPNPKHSGDGGVDGEMTIHLGTDKKDNDIWGKMIFSVKTGSQCNPAMIRELWGTVEKEKAFLGGLILEEEPSDAMDATAEKRGILEYVWKKDMPPNQYPKLQILTAQEIIDGRNFKTPPTMMEIRAHRQEKQLF